jgi:hypothetical protein
MPPADEFGRAVSDVTLSPAESRSDGSVRGHTDRLGSDRSLLIPADDGRGTAEGECVPIDDPFRK